MKKLALAAMLVLSACPDDDDGPIEKDLDASVPDASSYDGGTYETVQSLDVLFVIDNSGSMADEQQRLARELPRMGRR